MDHDLTIDGDRIHDYDGFVAEFNRAYIAEFGGEPWDGEDLVDFHDMLTETGGRLIVHWIHSETSKAKLGHEELARYWRRAIAAIPAWALTPASFELLRSKNQASLDRAMSGQGQTMFEWLVFQIGDDELVGLQLE